MTRQEALAKIEELKTAIKSATKHIEKLAQEHNLFVYMSDPADYHSVTYLPNLDAAKEFTGDWAESYTEDDFDSNYGVQIPGWVSSSSFC